MNRVIARLLTADRRTILSNSSYFVSTTVVTAALGFGYWWLAARRFSPQEVGLAAAVVSAMTLLGNVAMLGFGTLLIAELHRRGDRAAAYVATALLISSMAGAVLGVGALLLAPWAPAELASFARDTGGIVLFPLGVALTTASLVADEALIGLLRGGTRFARNAVFAVGKLVVLAAVAVAVGGASAVTIFAAWVAGLLVSILFVVAVGLRLERRAQRYRPDAEVLRHLSRGMFQHHALNMAFLAPGLALPVVVATALSTTAAGYFYVASMMAGIVSIAAPALGITLYAVGSRSPSGLSHAMRLTLVLSFLITGAGCAVAVVAGRPLLSTFGSGYAAEGTAPLIVLTLATLPGIIKVHFIQVYRIARRIGTAAVITGAGAVLELSAAAIGARQGGLVGLSLGFALAVLLEATAMSPSVLGAAGLWRRPPASMSPADP
jgi:O-antigen/teichoic acid export membrane protein